ncbi:MAG TPA: T9SS type A sorting domain-containing protein [Calditrichaeota bacterium]|nr:T9SS type A sorting domain-containing protein [Calditrichota bacterium]
MKKFNHLLIIAVFLALYQTALLATTYYVSPDGSDSNPGTEASPWKTIQKAANTAVAGDVVYIKAGIYDESVVIANSGTADNYITFSAHPGDELQAKISSGSSDIFDDKHIKIIGKSYIKISGIHIENAKHGIRIEGPSEGVVLENNYTYNTGSSGISVWGVPWQSDPGNYDNIKDIVIKNNVIEKACNGGSNECITLANGVKGFEITYNTVKNGGDATNGGEGIDIKEGCSNGTIAYNEIYNLNRRAIYLDGGTNSEATPFGKPVVENIEIYNNHCYNQTKGQGLAIMTEGPGDVRYIKIYNNIFHDNASDGIMYYKHPDGSGVIHDITAINNTIYNNGRNGILSNFSTSYNMITRNNICYQNANKDIYLQSGSNTADHNLEGTDPLFVDAANGDYHLQSGSPAIDAGTNTDAPALDYDGNVRDGSTDIGAFEYGASSGQDVVNSAVSPSNVTQGSMVTVTVNYDATDNRDIHVDLQNKDDWTEYGSGLTTVSAADNGSVDVLVNVDANAPVGTNYRFNVYMTDVGGNYPNTYGDTHFIEGITVTAQQYTLTTNVSGNGSVTLSPSGGVYDAGTTVTVEAVPDAGNQFDNWNGDLTGTTNPAQITMDSDKTVTAHFSASSGGSGTVDVRISSGYDDAEEYESGGNVYINSSDLELVYDNSTTDNQFVGLRFSGIDVPQGASITKAYIQFTVDETDAGSASLTIKGQNSDNASAFSTNDFDISGRPTTAAFVNWNPPEWTSVGDAGSAQKTPDLKDIVDKIVNRAGWSSGNSMAFIITGSGTRTAESYEGSSSKAASLHIEYTTGSGATQDSVLSASSPTSFAPGETVTVTVNYQTSDNRDLHISLQNKDDWNNYGSAVQTVGQTDNGTVDMQVTVDANAPEGTNYRFNIYLTPVGENYPNVVSSTYKLEGRTVQSSGGGGFEGTIISAGSVWKYLDDGSDRGTAWQSLNYDDSGWATGNAQLGYGDGDEATVVSYGPSSSDKYVTTYFRKTFNMSSLPATSNLLLRIIRDDGAIVYINGTEVARTQMPAGTVNYLTRASTTASGSNESDFQDFTIASDVIQTGENVVCAEIHQVSSSSSDISFDLSLETTNSAPTVDFRKTPYLIYEGVNTEYTLLWQLKSTQTCQVDWGTESNYGSGTITSTEFGSDHQHKVTFTGLTPGQKYYYNVHGYSGSFYAALSDNATSAKLLFYGDTRSHPEEHEMVADAMLDFMNNDPGYQSIVVNSGDIVDEGDIESYWDDEFFETPYTKINTLLSQVGYQIARGNHERDASLMRKYFPYPYEVSDATYWSFDYGPVHIAIIDYYEDFSSNSAQINWLKNDLANTGKAWKIIALHRPGWSAGGHGNSESVQDIIQPICLQYDVKLVVTGHNHYYSRADVDGVQHITTGGGGAPPYTPDMSYPYIVAGVEAYHFCAVNIQDQSMDVSVIDIDGTQLDAFTINIGASKPAVSNAEPELPKSYALFPVYPNPFNMETMIKFSVPEDTKIRLSVYNVNGQKVANLSESYRAAGYHAIKWAAHGLPSGIYFIHFQSGNHAFTRKVLLVK